MKIKYNDIFTLNDVIVTVLIDAAHKHGLDTEPHTIVPRSSSVCFKTSKLKSTFYILRGIAFLIHTFYIKLFYYL